MRASARALAVGRGMRAESLAHDRDAVLTAMRHLSAASEDVEVNAPGARLEVWRMLRAHRNRVGKHAYATLIDAWNALQHGRSRLTIRAQRDRWVASDLDRVLSSRTNASSMGDLAGFLACEGRAC